MGTAIETRIAAAQAGDESAFVALTEPHRRELRVHCYRMVGSLEESEDLVQETFLRAWQHLSGFAGRATFRGWLYRIATNACLDALETRNRRFLPPDLAPPAGPAAPPRTDIPWLQPLPDRLCEGPEVAAVDRETIELAFLAAIQHLPPRQRAVLILRDVLGWPAKETAAALSGSVASVNSALQRARETLRDRLPARRADWTGVPTAEERAVLRRYMVAMEQADLAAVAELLAADVRAAMPPWPMWMQGRDPVLAALATSWDPSSPWYVGRIRTLPAAANRQPAAATYVQRDGAAYYPFAISVLRIVDGRIIETTAFHDPGLFRAFALPLVLHPHQRSLSHR